VGRLSFWEWPLLDGVDPEHAAQALEDVFRSAVLFGAVPPQPAQGELLTFLRRVEREAASLLATLDMPALAKLLVLQAKELRAHAGMRHIASGLYAKGAPIFGRSPDYIRRLVETRTLSERLQRDRELRTVGGEQVDAATDQADYDVAYGCELLTLAPAAVALLVECAHRAAAQAEAARERRGPERDMLRAVLFRQLADWHLRHLGKMETRRTRRDEEVWGGRSAEMAQEAISYAARRLRSALIGPRSPPGLYDDSVRPLLKLARSKFATIARLLEEGRASLAD
jgi:hypothetical protein